MDRTEIEKPDIDDPAYKNRTVYVCIPSRGTICVSLHNFLMNKDTWCQRANIGSYREFLAEKMGVRDAREFLMDCVASQLEQFPTNDGWILWLDDDMVPPHHNGIAAMMWSILYSEIHSLRHKDGAQGLCGECNQDLSTPVAPIGVLSAWASRKEPMDAGLLFAPGTKLHMVPKIDFTPGEVIEVDWSGLAFSLMRADWIAKLKKPRFTSNDGGGAEDHDFCKALRKVGCIPYVHTGLKVGHLDTMKQSVFFPYLAPTGKKADGVKVEPFVPAWMTCGMPELHKSMYEQFSTALRSVAFDNGGEPRAVSLNVGNDHACRVIRSDTNLLWARGFNAAMASIVATYPDADAIWLCNDDITGVSVEMGRALYRRLMEWPNVAAVSPAIQGSHCGESTKLTQDGVRKVHFIDFVCPMINLSAWRKIGPLDPDTMGNGWGNDIEWGYRANKAGYMLLVDDGLVVNHENPSQTMKKLGVEAYHNGYLKDAFKSKHGLTVEEFYESKELEVAV